MPGIPPAISSHLGVKPGRPEIWAASGTGNVPILSLDGTLGAGQDALLGM